MTSEQKRRYEAGLVRKHLNLDSRVRMIADRLAGARPVQLAKRYDVSKMTVWRILRCIPAMILLGLCTVGCDHVTLNNVRPIAAPLPEQPVVQLPASMRQRNWTVSGEGSCVYASLATVARWHHKQDLAAWLSDPSQNGGGEYGKRLRERLDQIGQRYAFTEAASVAFLDWCSETRHGCIVWWKQSHCCTFAGWVRMDGKIYAAIIDNNHPEYFEFTERSMFLRGWTGFGGFGLTLLDDPASPRPWLAYTSD